MKKTVYLIILLLAMVFVGCANKGIGPQGGPKDSIPPVIVKELPENGALRFQGEELALYFNEYIQLDDAQNKVLMSPPQKTPPTVKAIGKRVLVQFGDTLAPETTYSIDFGTAICDNNERNPLGNYVFSFSTGDVIDSLVIEGRLLNAENLNPLQGVLIGLHSDPADSAISVRPFNNVARTDSAGHFVVKNVHEGTYRVYALNDVAKDFMYQPGDGLAFLDTLVAAHPVDTAGSDPGVLLRYFEEDKQRHYFVRCLREEPHIFRLLFSASQDSLPVFDSLPRHVLTPSLHLDTLTFWLLDSVDMLRDTIPFVMTYQFSDSLYNLVPKTDSVRAVYRAPKLSDKAKAALEKKNQERKLEIKSNASSKFDIFTPLLLTFPVPVDSFRLDSLHLYEMVDTIRKPLPLTCRPIDSSGSCFAVYYDWQAEQNYILTIDSAAFVDIYGHTHDQKELKWKIRSLDEYSTLTIRVSPYRPNLMVQLLSEKDQPVRTLRATAAGARFEFIKPASYYVRVYEDLNADSVWTTGDFLHHRQPEPIWYFPSKLTLRANWEFEEEVLLNAEATENKPQDIRKATKPGSDKKK